MTHKIMRIGRELVEVPLDTRTLAQRLMDRMRKHVLFMEEAMRNDTPINVTIGTIEHTPDGPLTTIKKVMMRPSELREHLRKGQS